MGILIWITTMKADGIFLLLLVLSIGNVKTVSDVQRITALEERVASLEATLNNLEPFLESRYELKRKPKTCRRPLVPNGFADACDEDVKPGDQCGVMCNAGYIQTPGKAVTTCQKDGSWEGELVCEIPLVVVSGGNTDNGQGGDSGVEILSLYPSKGCNTSIPDMPLDGGAHRSAHNLIYEPPKTMLACNGMSNNKNLATCDTWTFGKGFWTHHSYPNKGLLMMEQLCNMDMGGSNSMCGDNPNKAKGRYAAQAFHLNGKNHILGGMVYDKRGHDPVKTWRETNILGSDSWGGGLMGHDKGMEKKRAFFCAVNVQDTGALAIGGLGHSNRGNIVEKSVEYKRLGMNFHSLKDISQFSDMSIPRSGHGCAGIPGDDFRVLVSGGTQGFGQPALSSAEIFDWKTNSWKNVAQMKKGRFGHAVVTVGDKIFAIGGDDRNQNNVFDTIEEYDVKKNSWTTIGQKLSIPRSNFGFTLIPHSIIDGCVISKPLNE